MLTSDSLLALVFTLLLLTYPVQVNLVGDSHRDHDPDHHAESRAEDPQGL